MNLDYAKYIAGKCVYICRYVKTRLCKKKCICQIFAQTEREKCFFLGAMHFFDAIYEFCNQKYICVATFTKKYYGEQKIEGFLSQNCVFLDMGWSGKNKNAFPDMHIF